MATRSLATDKSATGPAMGLREEDYRTFCAALESTQRGRDFLVEYARRNRNADTEMLLDSLDRIETMMRAEGAARDRLQDELRVLLIAIRLARPDINSATALTKAARLVDLLDLMESRIDAMVENKDLLPVAEEPLAPQTAFKVVPRPDEPELPIPSVAAALSPIALVPEPPRFVVKPLTQQAQPTPQTAGQDKPEDKPEVKLQAKLEAEPYETWEQVAAPEPVAEVAAPAPPEKWLPDFGGEEQIIHTKPVTAAAFMPEVTFMSAPARPTVVETKSEAAVVQVAVTTVIAAAADSVAPEAAPAPTAKVVPPRVDPLSAIMSLSEAERIALFT
jgi:hypothetical protein